VCGTVECVQWPGGVLLTVRTLARDGWRRRSIPGRGLVCLSLVLVGMGLASCGGSGQLSAASSCKDFNQATAQQQDDIVVHLYDQTHPDEPKDGPGAANAVFNVGYECQAQPRAELGKLGDFSDDVPPSQPQQGSTATAPSTVPATDSTPAPASLTRQVTTVPSSVFDAVGVFSQVLSKPHAEEGGSALTQDGKPMVLYEGDEWCPYCAAARWSLVVALSRFGALTHLRLVKSSDSDVDPDTESWSFVEARLSSPDISFIAIEMQNREHQNLSQPNSTEAAAFSQYDDQGAIPFVDIADRYIVTGTFDPEVLHGMSWEQIASQLRDPHASVTEAILSEANVFAAAICQADGERPTNVCSSTGVKEGVSWLKLAPTNS